MRKIIIDTNVLVSSIISRSYPYYIITSVFLDKNALWCISDDVISEYQNVLRREKFSRYIDFDFRAENLLASIDTHASIFSPQIKLTILDDPDDNKFLELAATCQADFLITGNTKDFTMNSFGKTKIITPKEYWENHQ